MVERLSLKISSSFQDYYLVPNFPQKNMWEICKKKIWLDTNPYTLGTDPYPVYTDSYLDTDSWFDKFHILFIDFSSTLLEGRNKVYLLVNTKMLH